jgi:hypothetical protein
MFLAVQKNQTLANAYIIGSTARLLISSAHRLRGVTAATRRTPDRCVLM